MRSRFFYTLFQDEHGMAGRIQMKRKDMERQEGNEDYNEQLYF